jgi:hypothetical protein
MEWIGINKADPSQRKFEFDDSRVLTSDPPQYSVRFLDNNEVSSVVCDNVFKLKPVKPFARKRKLDTVESHAVATEAEIAEREQLFADISEELKPVWEKRRRPQAEPPEDVAGVRSGVSEGGSVAVTAPTVPAAAVPADTGHKYEYRAVLVRTRDPEQTQYELNGLGEDRWELVGMVPDGPKLLCIMKRTKR